jgi:cytidylate kinase
VDCDYGTRAKRTAAREKISLRQAKKYLDERDNANTRRYKKLYNLNQNDLSIYDIIFDNNRLSKEAAKRLPVIVVGRELRKRGVLK